jgi:hypothetical protein
MLQHQVLRGYFYDNIHQKLKMIGDSLLDFCLVIFKDGEIFFILDEDDIISIFMAIKKRRLKKNKFLVRSLHWVREIYAYVELK